MDVRLQLWNGAQRGGSDAWIPATDIFPRRDGDLVLLVELPGVRREDVDVSLAGGGLIIHGEKDGREEDAEYYAAERYSGSFRRIVILPDGLTEDRVSCHFEGCLPEIVVQDYSEVLEAKRVEIGSYDGRPQPRVERPGHVPVEG